MDARSNFAVPELTALGTKPSFAGSHVASVTDWNARRAPHAMSLL